MRKVTVIVTRYSGLSGPPWPLAPWYLNSEKCQVMNDIAMGEKKNMNLPGVKVDLPVLQERGGPRQVFATACSL